MENESLNKLKIKLRGPVLSGLKFLSFFFGLVAFLAFVMYYGYSWPEKTEESILLLVRLVIGFFFLNYAIRFFLAFDNREFIRDHPFESTLIGLLLLNLFFTYLLGIPLIQKVAEDMGFRVITPLYIFIVQIYLLLFAGAQILSTVRQIYQLRLSPLALFLGTFVVIISIGTGLLMLPEMTVQEGSMSFWDALFTSTSATCVTGLIVVDTATYFTFKGHLVILALIQLGGIGIISFALFFSIFLKKGLGLRHELLIKDYFNSPDILYAKKLLVWVIGMTFLLEVIGVISMYHLWDGHKEFEQTSERIFYSIFHAVSAFTNAGFTLFSGGFFNEAIRDAYLLHFVTGILIFLGALGFPVIRELTNLRLLRDRMRKPWMDWSLNTKIGLHTSLLLVLIGTPIYWYFEQGASLAGKDGAEVLITSVFQIVTRTAGFNTVNIGELAVPVLFMLIIFMFIGASTASVGGGIKTSTFIIIVVAIKNVFQRQSEIKLGNRSIPNDLLHKAYAIFVFSVGFVMVMLFALTITEPNKQFLDLLFETVSAYGTVGLSMGVTDGLSTPGKFLITITMLTGRLSTLAIVIIMGMAVTKPLVKYPKEDIMIG